MEASAWFLNGWRPNAVPPRRTERPKSRAYCICITDLTATLRERYGTLFSRSQTSELRLGVRVMEDDKPLSFLLVCKSRGPKRLQRSITLVVKLVSGRTNISLYVLTSYHH